MVSRFIVWKRRPRFLVITMKVLTLANKWYDRIAPIPQNMTRLYQLLLQLVWMKGVMNVGIALRAGYSREIINRAVSAGYAEIASTPRELSEDLRKGVMKMIGRPPKELYA